MWTRVRPTIGHTVLPFLTNTTSNTNKKVYFVLGYLCIDWGCGWTKYKHNASSDGYRQWISCRGSLLVQGYVFVFSWRATLVNNYPGAKYLRPANKRKEGENGSHPFFPRLPRRKDGVWRVGIDLHLVMFSSSRFSLPRQFTKLLVKYVPHTDY